MRGSGGSPPALLLDEMHQPKVAAEFWKRGYDVVAVADTVELRALSDAELFRWASALDLRPVPGLDRPDGRSE